MSQLSDAFKGHDLTGWTSHPYSIWPIVIRATEHWDLVRISPFSDGSFEAETLAPMKVLARGTLSECVAAADKYAEANYGWAPAPIGSDPGWQPIGTYQIPAGPTFPAFTGGNSETGFVGECYWASVGQEFQHYGGPVELTHYKPLPAPPEAKP